MYIHTHVATHYSYSCLFYSNILISSHPIETNVFFVLVLYISLLMFELKFLYNEVPTRVKIMFM